MKCSDVHDNLDLYIDGELHDLERGDIEAHIARCPSCAEAVADAQTLKRQLHDLADEARLSDAFRARLASAIAAAPVPAPAVDAPRPVPSGIRYGGLALAAAALLAAGVALGVGLAPDEATSDSVGPQSVNQVAGVTDINTPVVTQSIEWHRRQVPVEVTGPNAAAVGAWFDGKVPFAVRAPDLGRDALLLGGRLGNVDETPAALLVYDVAGTKLSVLLYDATGIAAPTPASDGVYVDNSDGYTVAVGERAGVGYTFTSDLPEGQLVRLVNASMTR